MTISCALPFGKMLDVPPVRLRFFQQAEHQDLAISHPAEMLTLDMMLTAVDVTCVLGL